ncbi:MAG: UDP-N-acetylmuramate dehydrogenase [Candidatus Liptonbacteria bacterium]|nr:UDP-N-acetylmuramate dehydrogenase [Candidatus Liptonbacteria bacterium]
MIKIKENVPLSEWSSYRIGGTASYFFDAEDFGGIKEALEWAKKENQPVFILGGGTNLLIDDKGFRGLVLKPSLNFIEAHSEEIEVGAGVKMHDLLNFTIKKGLSGLEWAGGLPGTFGGAIRGNAGAFKGEIKDVVRSVKGLDTETLKEVQRSQKECRFGYRSSIFKEKNGAEIILGATLKLKKGNQKEIQRAIEEKIDYRLARHPMEYPNIGSIFKNVAVERFPKNNLAAVEKVIKVDPFPVVPTAYLISEAGLKGVALGGAMVSPKHPNFIVNVLNAQAEEVRSLIELVKSEVKKKFKIELEEEVQKV